MVVMDWLIFIYAIYIFSKLRDAIFISGIVHPIAITRLLALLV